MRKEVVFGGGEIDRAAALRGDAAAISALHKQDGAFAVVLWRGKPLVQIGAKAQLCRLPVDHPVVAGHRTTPVFLGLVGGAPAFAVDLPDWDDQLAASVPLNAFADQTEQAPPGARAGQVFAELRRVMTGLSADDAELAATARALFSWHESHGCCARCGAATELAEAGWQRVCPRCSSRHFPRTDPVVIMLVLHGNSVLVGRSPGWPDGMYSLLAGFVEPGETLEAAVRREVLEETAIRCGAVSYLATQPWPFPTSLMFGCVARAETRDITVDPAELDDALWITREDMADIFEGQHQDILAPRDGAIARHLLEKWLNGEIL